MTGSLAFPSPRAAAQGLSSQGQDAKQPGRPDGLSLASSEQGGFDLAEFEVVLPRPLRRFGHSVKASLIGATGAPLIVVLGGISANRFPCMTSDAGPGWWSGLAGAGKAIDPARYRILGVDFVADDCGKFAPSTRDQAAAVCAVLDHMSEGKAEAIVGASYGGMTALCVAEHFAERVARIAIVSAPAAPHPMATAARDLQRRIVDLSLKRKAGEEGLALARGLAMLTYRSPEEFERRFTGGIDSEDALHCSAPGAYLHARGQAFCAVMSPGRFLSLSASIDRHRADPQNIRVPALLIGSTTDQLVPPEQMSALARAYGGPASLNLVASPYGHDMFLKQAGDVGELVHPFLRSEP